MSAPGINQNKQKNRVPQDAEALAHKVRSWNPYRFCVPLALQTAIWVTGEGTTNPQVGCHERAWRAGELRVFGRALKREFC